MVCQWRVAEALDVDARYGSVWAAKWKSLDTAQKTRSFACGLAPWVYPQPSSPMPSTKCDIEPEFERRFIKPDD